MSLFTVGIAAAAGLILGGLAPTAAEHVCRLKYAQKKQELPSDRRYTSLPVLLLCILCTGGGFGVMAYFADRIFALLLGGLIWFVGTVLILVDLRIRILPNEAVLLLAGAGGILQWYLHGLSGLLIAMILMLIIMLGFIALGGIMGLWKIGAGDVKLAGVMGLTLGHPQFISGLLIMALSLLLFCVAGLLLKKITLKSMVAFGPFLVCGLLGGLLFLV